MHDRHPPAAPVPAIIACLLCGASLAIQADYKADIGYSQLVLEQGATTPDGSGVHVTQAEASTSGTGNDPVYLPDPGAAEFLGKVITDKSGSTTGTFSSHATGVGKRFYGITSSIAPGLQSIHAFLADDWLEDGFLRTHYPVAININLNVKPLDSPSRVASHSWIAAAEVAGDNADYLRRIDWVVETDEFIQCVGIKNSASPNSPLLSSAYNVIAVGKSDGLNGYGTIAVDGDYVADRTRPELVAPLSTSSAATPVVAAAAALLVEIGHANPALSTDPLETTTLNRNGDTIYNAERSEVVKAVLMAAADRSTANSAAPDIFDYRIDPAHQTVNGLDTRFGAGQVNIYNSFHILSAGEQNSQEDAGSGAITTAGFDYDPAFGGSGGSNTSASYTFSTGEDQAMLWITLAWNIDIDGGNGNSFSGNAQKHDLDLHLYDMTGGMVLLESSTSSIDSTETLWTTLPASRDYLLRVVPKSGQAAFLWDYALAWRMADLVDTDGDGIPDIHDPDDDNDGLSDEDEGAAGTDPLDSDSDDDLFLDSTEVLAGTDPLLSTDFPEWGDINGDGSVDTADIILAARAATGTLTLNSAQLARGNVAPLLNGVPETLPTDVFDSADLLLIYRKAMGKASF